jgi:ATP-dependent DNA helicase RecQ
MDAVGTLKRHWGYDGFRPLQREIVDSILAGHDTLGLMPTGGGKSITFQVPGMMLDGVTVVVTPLISLMKDQVDNLQRRRIKAVALHSGMTRAESERAREKLLNGGAKFLYVSPERLRNDNFIAFMRMITVSLIVVDEAHCISQWGYDFRPAYLNIKRLRKEKPGVPVLALTATATPEVADDICTRLEMQSPQVFRMSFTRENINYIVRPSETKINEVFHILSRTSGTAIVYVRSRKRTGEIADYLRSAGISAAGYHAGLSHELKEERQNMWKNNETRVMVATNAFGMGIDKPDVRVVIHYDLPPSLEEYYQEAGRAGRDGKTSYAVLLTSRSDTAKLRRRVTEAFPDRDIIRKVYERVCNVLHISIGEGYDTLKEFDIEKFCETFHYQPRQCRAALRLLQQAGYLEYMEEADRRSRVIMTCRREELYHMHGLSEMAENTLTRILRGYTGLFTDYVQISEPMLAMSLNVTERQIYESLLELGRAKVLNYIPRNRMPLMYLPTSREEPRYLIIGKSIYEERRDVMRERTEAMLDYAFNPKICRENRMLEYFGEKRDCRCGRCDVCRERNRSAKREDGARLTARILEYLRQNPQGTYYPIFERDMGADRKALGEALSFLSNEGYIEIDEGRITLCSD